MRCLRWLDQRPWLLLPLVAIPALLPFFTVGLTASADGATHLIRLALLDHHVRDGMLYPRWVPELALGLGYPVFNFYGPATYYLAEVFRLGGLTLGQATIAAYAVMLLAAGFGMYALARDVFGASQRWAAFVAASAYMVAPYLLTNTYIRGAIAEVGAQTLLPWILWSARRLITDETPARYVLALAFTLGGLAITHTITLILFPPFLIAYIVVVWWQNGRHLSRLGWVAVGLGAALGLSAFFWMPVVGERQYLSRYAYEISAKVFVPENVWTWSNFLDTSIVFKHTFAVPFRLGLVQLALAVLGVIVARRRDLEWVYFIVVSALACLAIGAWAIPIWQSNQLLLATQFPWRLLTIVTVAFSLFSGAIVLRIRRDSFRAAAALALVLVIVLANRPQVDWMGPLAMQSRDITLGDVAHYEYQTGQVGTGSTLEFMPRWNQGMSYTPAPEDHSSGQLQVAVQKAGAYGLQAEIDSASGGQVRFSSLYFPGWRAALGDGTVLRPYPSTNLGLLTVDVPPGSHRLIVSYAGTSLQHVSQWITLLTLAALALFAWRAIRPRWIAAVPLGLLVVGLAAQVVQPSMAEMLPPAYPMATEDLAMVGYRADQGDDAMLTIYPTWYVRKALEPGTRIGWQLRDSSGQAVNFIAPLANYDSQEASSWPPGTLVDDAYQLPLPAGLRAGAYEIDAFVLPPGSRTQPPTAAVATIDLAATAPEQAVPHAMTTLGVEFDGVIRLEGVDRQHDDQPMTSGAVVKPGDTLTYTLYWRAIAPLFKDYRSFLHLVNRDGNAVVKQEHVPGASIPLPVAWDAVSIQKDRYELQVPDGVANGLLWPTVVVYDYDTQNYLQVWDSAGQPIGDVLRLSPVKVFSGNPAIAPQHVVQARLGEHVTLLGYDLLLPEAGLRPGAPLTVTLYYQGEAPTPQDLTQFVHLDSPDLGTAAQKDSPPLDGGNPTSIWVPGEIVVDRSVLTVADDAAPGIYGLRVGLYDPGTGIRARAIDQAGKPLPDDAVHLADLRIEP